MTSKKLYTSSTLLLLLVSQSVGFQLLPPKKGNLPSHLIQQTPDLEGIFWFKLTPPARKGDLMSRDNEDELLKHGLKRFMGIFSLYSLLGIGVVNAAVDTNSVPLQVPFTGIESSSIQTSAQVKVLDMSMPSYGDLKDYKASVENVPSLSKPDKFAAISPKRSPIEAPLSAKREKPPKASQENDTEKDDKGDNTNVKTMDASMPKYNF